MIYNLNIPLMLSGFLNQSYWLTHRTVNAIWLFFFFSFISTIATAKSLQSCLTLCDPIDGSPPGSPVPWTPQARTLEWVAISLSDAWNWKVKVKSFSRVRLLATLWTAAYQAPQSMGVSRQEYWSGVPLPSPSYNLIFLKNLERRSWHPVPSLHGK